MVDKTDFEILSILKKNSKTQMKDIGEMVHLTGQAVSSRISAMEKQGVIKGYTAVLDQASLGKCIIAYITIHMKTTEHSAFQTFVKANGSVEEAHRISGSGCYLLKVLVSSHEELNSFLDSVLKYGNYGVSISIGKVK